MKMIHAELKIDNCPAELWLNDIPLARLGPDQSHNVSIPAHLYLLDGVNTLEILAYPGPTPSLARQRWVPPNAGGAATARVAAYDEGEFTGSTTAPVLIEVSWNSAGPPVPYPQSVRASENLGGMFGRWDWENAERLQLDQATVASAAAVLDEIRVSLAAGSADVLMRLADRKFRNASVAYPARPYDTLVAQFRRVVARDASEREWGFPKLDPKQFDFRLAAGGRLLECVNRDWRPTLRTHVLSDGYPKYYPMLLCRLDGQREVAI